MLEDLFNCLFHKAIDLLYRPITIYLERNQYVFHPRLIPTYLFEIPLYCFQVILYVCIWSLEILKLLRDIRPVTSSTGRSQLFYTLVHLLC
jgi:hypothetical protein